MTENTVVVSDEEMEAQLPKPVGYRILIALPQIEETFGSGIVGEQQYLREIEPFLLEFGYIQRVPSRQITASGLEFLRKVQEQLTLQTKE